MGWISVLILLHLALSLNMFDASAFWNIFLFGFQKVHYLIIPPPPPWISGKFFIFVRSFRSLQTLNFGVPLSSQLSFFVCVHILLGISFSLMTKILSNIHRFISLTCVSSWLCTHICLLDTFARVISKYIKFNNWDKLLILFQNLFLWYISSF